MNQASKKVLDMLVRAGRMVGRTLYVVGIQTVRIQRRIQRFFTPVRNLFFRACYQLFGRRYHWLREEVGYLRRASLSSRQRMKELHAGDRRSYRGELSRFWKRILSHFGSMVGLVVNIAAPVAAILLLVHTAQYWTGLSYGLQLEYNGQSIGLVQNEGNVGDVVNMVAGRIVSQNTDTVDVTPTYELTTITDTDHFTSYNALCDTIVSSSDNNIVAATGLYVDNEFVAAVRSRTDLRFILQTILKSSESEDGTLSAAFVQDVELIDGMYTENSILSSEDMQTKLTATQDVEQTYTVKEGDAPLSITAQLGITLSELQGLNPDYDLTSGSIHIGDKLVISGEKGFFTIKQVKQVTYSRPIAYDTITQKTSSLYIGNSKVVTNGVEGQEQVVDLVTYVDGKEVGRENISVTTTKNPVSKVVRVGTAMRPTMYTSVAPSGSTGSTGVFMWPVPSSRLISDGFGYLRSRYHGAIDIVCSYATVVAADSGYVVSAGWDSGYGWCILVQHDNGLQTFYAHCSKLLASAGASVSKGQSIAISGETGYWAEGPHLHFEVRLNNVKVNPLKYV